MLAAPICRLTFLLLLVGGPPVEERIQAEQAARQEKVLQLERELAGRLDEHGEMHLETAAALFDLAIARELLEEYEVSARLHERALATRRELLGEVDLLTADSQYALAKVHFVLGEYSEAVRLHERALETRLTLSEEDSLGVLNSLHKLALAKRLVREHAEAATLLERLLILVARLGDGHAFVVGLRYELARNRSALGDFEEALRLDHRALVSRLELYGEQHVDTADSLLSLAHDYGNLGRHDEATGFMERALRAFDAVGGLHGASGAAQLLAGRREVVGQIEEALRLNELAVSHHYTLGTPAHEIARLALMKACHLRGRQGDMAGVRRLLEEHHRRCVEAYGAADPRVAPILAQLAIHDWEGEGAALARERLEEALRIGAWEDVADDHGSEDLLPRIRSCLTQLGRLEEARLFAQRAAAVMDRFHPRTEWAFERHAEIADVCLQLGEFAEAEAEARLALGGYESLRGAEYPKAQEQQFELARALIGQGRFDDAEPVLRRLLSIRERMLPDDHSDLQEVRLRLAESLRATGKQVEADVVQESITDVMVYRPVMLVQSPDRLESSVERRSFSLEVLITDYSGVADVRVVRDGFALSIRRLEKEAEHLGKYLTPDRTGQRASLSFPLRFRDGQTEMALVVSAQNRRGQWSEPTRYRVKYAPPQRELYLLAMGVGDYAEDELDLGCPVNDVDGVIDAFQAQEGGFYSKVHVERMVDADVTAAAARRVVDQFLVKAQPRDTIVVLVAGHGVRTEHSEYYFLTADATPADPYPGIDRGAIEALVMSEKLNAKRRLLLLDTCHAGGREPGARGGSIRSLVQPDEVEAFGTDEDASGIYLLASSTDDGFAREMEGNGIFTRALLDGLAGAADTGPFGDGNGFVEIEELKQHIYVQVLEKSMGRQRATVPKVISGENFPLARVADVR